MKKMSLHFAEERDTTHPVVKVIKGLFLTVFTVLVIGIITAALFLKIFLTYIQDDLMASKSVIVDLGAMPVNLSSTIYYKSPETGEYVEWYTLANTENRFWIDGKDIPKRFKEAFIAIEDERFLEHNGVDWKRTLAATASSLSGQSVFGGSTITQQLIKNLTGENQVTVKRKITEICRALKLEENYSKDEILEWYMNVIFFGRKQYGIGSAAMHYFNKEVQDLSLAQICSIVAITNNPSKYDPYNYPGNNKNRQETILQKMLERGYIGEAEYRQAVQEEIVFSEHTEQQELGTEAYPYYVDAVVEDVISFFQESAGITRDQATTMLYYGGYQIYSCVDMDIQEKMDSVYQNPDNIPKTRDGRTLESSMVVIDPYTGDIVGMEGGVGPKTVARGLNWATSKLGRRPPGSSIKPIAVYGPAMDQGLITPNTYYLDSKDIQLKGTSWYPLNYSRRNYGTVTIRYSIAQSLNTVSAQVLDKLTPQASYQFLTQTLHMNLEEADCDYAPLAAGQLTIGTTTREMASAFTIFPTGGTFRQGRTFSHIYDHTGENLVYENPPVTEQAVSDKTAYWMTDMLQDVVQSGTGTAARMGSMPVAGKTGTTTDDKDRWFVGFTPYYVGAVWTGHSKPAVVRASGNPAITVWKQVMNLIHEDLEPKKFPVPDDISLPKVTNVLPAVTKPETPEEEIPPDNYEAETPPDDPTPDMTTPPETEEPPSIVPETPPENTDNQVSEEGPTLSEFDLTPPAWLMTQ
ncbi:MAG: transglycosylase domain-containing protein [Oscillospiraceae bacterium]|nr:transglycosylase domain-containing protein [Oscillospiraceae bacterium]